MRVGPHRHLGLKNNMDKYRVALKSQRAYIRPSKKQVQSQKLVSLPQKHGMKLTESTKYINQSYINMQDEEKKQEVRISRRASLLDASSQEKYRNKIEKLRNGINLAQSRLRRYQSLKQPKIQRYATQSKPTRQSIPRMHASEHKPRSKSQQTEYKKCQNRRVEMRKNLTIGSASTQQVVTFKNEKLTIVNKVLPKLVQKMSRQSNELDKFGLDMIILAEQFGTEPKSIQITRYISQGLKTILGKLIFFIGYESFLRYSEHIQPEFQAQQIILGSYYQIYYSMRLQIPVLILQCYQVLMDFALERGNYIHAQRYAEKCLQAAIYYKQKYYEEKSIEKISMCEYYRGNICQATYLHDNNGQVTQDSIKKIRDGYNQTEQMQIIFHHLYQLPRFDVRQLLLAQDQASMKGYKAMVVFQSPRIGLDDSMKSKKNQLKIDIMAMQRLKQFKMQAAIMKKQFKRHQNLFTVRKTEGQTKDFKLIKRNLSIDEQNQSSQVLRAHQSMNRINAINKKPIRTKLISEYSQFCKAIVNRLNVTAIRINLLNF